MLSSIVIADLKSAVGADGVIVERNQLQTYECDGLAALRTIPAAVVLPRSTAEVQSLVQICARHQIPFVARGAGRNCRQHCCSRTGKYGAGFFGPAIQQSSWTLDQYCRRWHKAEVG